MAQKAGSTRARVAASAKSRARKVAGPKAMSRIEKSLDAADVALKDLRKELGRGGRDVIKDFEAALNDSRKNFRSLSKTVARDIEKLQKAATRGAAPKPAAKRSTAKTTSRPTRRASGTSRKTSSRSASSRSTSSRSGSRSSSAASRSGSRSTPARSSRSRSSK